MRISLQMVAHSFAAFRTCGRGERECVVFWTGPLDDPDVADDIVHPSHTSHFGSYCVEPSWIVKFWRRLADERRAVLLQAHTHPGRAFHSVTDDRFPMIQTRGFLSLVLPNFALGDASLANARLYELHDGGVWRAVPMSTLVVADD
jgi:hypothetical protein